MGKEVITDVQVIYKKKNKGALKRCYRYIARKILKEEVIGTIENNPIKGSEGICVQESMPELAQKNRLDTGSA